MTTFRKWKSIEKFSDAYKTAQKYGVVRLTYNAKIKLHGTNAGIRMNADGTYTAQKRSSDITVANDNAGFAAFVDSLPVDSSNAEFVDGTILYGEWAGKGVQKDDAVSSTERAFYVFSAAVPTLQTTNDGVQLYHITYEPEVLTVMVEAFFRTVPERVHVLPWFFDDDITVQMNDQDAAQQFIDYATEQVDVIGECDPYIKEKYDVEGPGEGLVFYCKSITTGMDGLLDGPQLNEMLMGYMFKHKTEAHSVNKTKRTHVAVPKPEGIDQFIEMFATEARFMQMIEENDLEFDKKNTGAFMKAVMSDIYKESHNEIEAADFEWKDAAKYLPNAVRAWWFNQCDKL